LIGIGGGIIMVPLLLLMGFTQQQAQGTSLAALLPPVTLLAVIINYHKAGFVDWRYAIIISLVFIVGGFFGSKIAIHVDQKTLKNIFAGVLVIIAGYLFLEK
jgi:uncharacterized membrane protein YfcA